MVSGACECGYYYTVLGIELKKRGEGAVLPFALASCRCSSFVQTGTNGKARNSFYALHLVHNMSTTIALGDQVEGTRTL